MPDPFGFEEGAKTLSGSLDSSRSAAKNLTKSIEGIQNDGADVARQKARDRIQAQREAELRKQNALIKALEEWKRKKQISDEEAKLKDESYQVQLTDAIMRGIERYFANNPPLARNRSI